MMNVNLFCLFLKIELALKNGSEVVVWMFNGSSFLKTDLLGKPTVRGLTKNF